MWFKHSVFNSFLFMLKCMEKTYTLCGKDIYPICNSKILSMGIGYGSNTHNQNTVHKFFVYYFWVWVWVWVLTTKMCVCVLGMGSGTQFCVLDIHTQFFWVSNKILGTHKHRFFVCLWMYGWYQVYFFINFIFLKYRQVFY